MSQNKARTPFDDPDNSGVDIPLTKNTQPLPPAGTVLSGLQSGTPTGNMATTPPPDYSTAPPDYSTAPPPTYTPPAVFAPQPPHTPPAYAPPTPPPPPPAYAAPPAYPTQPPTYPPPAQQPVYAPPTQQTVVYASAPPVATPPVATPPVAAPPVAAPNAAASTGPLPGSRSKIPLPTLIGLAVAGGVVLAVAIPIMMRRAIPKVEMKDPPPAVAVATPITRQPIAKAPLVDDLEVGSEPAPTAARPLPQATARATDEPAESGVPASAQGNGGLDSDPADTEEDVVPGVESPDAQPNPAPADDAEAGTAASTETGESPGTEGEPASSPSGGVSVAGNAGTRAGAKRGRARRSERNEAWNYSIAAPEGWAKTQSGKRTIWAGPDGAQLLVEVSEDVGSSPRADWEKLDRAFRKKYGRRYRNLGIRNTSLAGLPAAEWEFELDSRGGGTTRKIDVAVHQGRRGYAVLGSGRAEDMPELRPQIQAAIDSFQLSSQGGAGETSEQPERGF